MSEELSFEERWRANVRESGDLELAEGRSPEGEAYLNAVAAMARLLGAVSLIVQVVLPTSVPGEKSVSHLSFFPKCCPDCPAKIILSLRTHLDTVEAELRAQGRYPAEDSPL